MSADTYELAVLRMRVQSHFTEEQLGIAGRLAVEEYVAGPLAMLRYFSARRLMLRKPHSVYYSSQDPEDQIVRSRLIVPSRKRNEGLEVIPGRGYFQDPSAIVTDVSVCAVIGLERCFATTDERQMSRLSSQVILFAMCLRGHIGISAGVSWLAPPKTH